MHASQQLLELYDTTLRDGTQGLGISLTLPDKIAIAQRLDEMGFDYVEGGFPLSNPKDAAFFEEAKTIHWKHAKICAFGMTRRRGVSAAEDAGLRALVDSGAPVITIVGKTHPAQVEQVMNVSLEENLAMIADSVAHCRQAPHVTAVFYDAEHFFDGYKADASYAMATLKAAMAGGATRLVLCDTNGGSLPAEVGAATRAAFEFLGLASGGPVQLGIHTHNDSGLAIANAMAAVSGGAVQVQGTINGIGERCGNADLVTMAGNASFKMGRRVLAAGALERLTELSRFVHARCSTVQPTGQPYTGPGAFAHKGGMHAHAVGKGGWTYEHIAPESVGNARRVVVSELSGVSNIAATMLAAQPELAQNKALQRQVLERVQDLEHAGWVFEDAPASLELLVKDALGARPHFFKPLRYRCEVAGSAYGASTEATVKVNVGGQEGLHVAEGDGPVNALDSALRAALAHAYGSQLCKLHLRDYVVRVVNPTAESAAQVRVRVDFASGGAHPRTFSTLGVDANIIAASFRALCDGFDYHLMGAVK